MAEFYEMPAVSPTMETGTLVAWVVKEGQSFDSGTVLAEVGTDKANMDAEIFDKGVLIKHLIPEGDDAPAGFPIAIIGASADEDISDLLKQFETLKAGREASDAPPAEAAPEQAPAASAPKEAPTTAKGDAPATKAASPAAKGGRPAPTGDITRTWDGKPLSKQFMDVPGDVRYGSQPERVAASPLARRIAEETGVDLRRVTGSGPGGRIVKDDVLNAPTAGSAATSTRPDNSVRNSPMRKTIAKRLLQSHQSVPVFYLTATFDMQGFVALRDQVKAALPDRKISYNDILIKAVARALREHPLVNAQWSDDAIVQKGAVDVGIAVALPAGLITPVIRNADQLTVTAIAAEVRALAGRAKDGKLKPEEYTGSTFTISNLGMFGIEQFTAIINPPEAAILAVGGIEQVPVVTDGQLTTGWRMKVTMSCDHRVIDGAVGAAFLQTLRIYVERPALLVV